MAVNQDIDFLLIDIDIVFLNNTVRIFIIVFKDY